MTLTGTYSRNLDDKRRLAVPKRLKEQFGEKDLTSLYVAPGTERSLALYSPEEFEKLSERFGAHSSGRPEYRNYLRLFFARSERVEFDSQGRIRIPEWLVDLAQLKKDVILLGVHDHAEIWDQNLWNEFLTKHVHDFDRMASAAYEPTL
ncbi:MAG: division/cell wall cluster transcriptional repressor MraZ [Planctomycetaceae bacterium]